MHMELRELLVVGLDHTLMNVIKKCFVNGCFSKSRSLRCGAPQGTILGPLLFLIYINDLPNCLLHSRARMFADDTNLTYASNSIHDFNLNFNEDLANVSQWLSANALTLNQSKTGFILIGSLQRISTFQATPALTTINNVPVKQVSHTKSLGTHIDENLSWNVHIEKLCKKVTSGIGAIKRIRPSPVNKIKLQRNNMYLLKQQWMPRTRERAT